jgi:tetratricopeptide (TPR) repeat protein
MPTGKDWRELLEVARAADPDPWRNRFRKAVLNDDRRALIELAALAPIASLPAETVDRLGDALIGGRAIHEAAAFLKKGQRLHPQDYWINVNLGNCLAQLGPQHLDEAIRFYTAAVALRPESVISHSNLGNALAQQGKPDEAAAAYGEAETIRLKAVVAACREAVRLKPDNHLAHYNLGVVLCKQGKLDEAIAAYKEALRLEPDLLAKEIINNLAFHFVACSEPMACNPQRAIELVEQVMAQNPIIAQNPNAALLASLLASSAPMLLLADDTDAYRQLCARVIEKLGDTKEPRTAYLVARICALAPDAAPDAMKVVQMAERAVQADPVPHHLHTLGLAHYRAAQFDASIQKLHKSIDGNWNANAANWLVLAMAHQRLGNADEARKWFDKAVAWIENTGLEAPGDSVGALRSLHRHDSLACMVLRREAEALLGLQPQPAPDSQEAPGEKK